jgi:phospholipase C
MKLGSPLLLVLLGALASVGCSAGADDGSDSSDDALTGETATPIKHVVLIVQENHTFDSYFGKYCTAKTDSNPTCHDGPGCCEAAPGHIWSAHYVPIWPEPLDDAFNVAGDRIHSSECEYFEMHCSDADYGAVDATAAHVDNGGTCKMDRYVDAAVWAHGLCGRIGNFAVAPPSGVATYHGYAREGALGDNYFQPIIGQTSSNDMFLARAQFEFKDNGIFPDRAGADCQIGALPDKPKKGTYSGKTTIADLLVGKNRASGFGYYHVGYEAAKRAGSSCAQVVTEDCPEILRATSLTKVACLYDPSDDPFKYYDQFGDDSPYIHDYNDLAKDVAAKKLPDVVYVKATTAMDEHPAFGSLTRGQAFVKKTVDTIMQSDYANDTLVLVTWDEGGGFYDHKSPPIAPDGRRYGTRIPILALGKFARKNYISHVQMEHSSILKFLEWNFLGKETGQLDGRDKAVKNIGSLLDPSLGVPDGEQ